MGMMGIRLRNSNIALVETCDTKEPDSECLLEDIKLKWIDYIKKKLPDWHIEFKNDVEN